jgi:hypothetical protein
MATFKLSKATQEDKTWKAEGTNPDTGKKLTIQGGQKGVEVGKKNPQSEKSFDARHDATGMTPKKHINKLLWDDEAKVGDTVEIPDELFKKMGK